MKIKIFPKPLLGNVPAVTSKSHAHRLLIAAALAKSSTKISLNSTSMDIETTRKCLSQFKDNIPILDCRESGSTLRFLLPLAMVLKDQVTFMGSGRLPERPLSPLKEEMEAHGCTFSNGETEAGDSVEIYTVSGRLQEGVFTLPGNVSSQYITGLLFALPLLKRNSRIEITSPLESKSYVKLTLEVLSQFGVQISVIQDGSRLTFKVPGGQHYVGPKVVTPEGDWSNSAFWIISGILTESSAMTCTGLNMDSVQGDREILHLVRRFGGKIMTKEHRVMSLYGPLQGIHIDASAIPDLVPILAVAASVAKGTTRIHHAERLRIKESDRLAALHDCLARIGADVTEEPGGLIINGVPSLKGGTVSGYNDHRIVMAMAIASSVCKGPLTIDGAEAVKKSYPAFFEDFIEVGGNIDEI